MSPSTFQEYRLVSQRVHELIIEILWKISLFWLWFICYIRSKICTCHDSSAVMTCAKLWPDIINYVHDWVTCILTRVGLRAHKPFVKWTSCYTDVFWGKNPNLIGACPPGGLVMKSADIRSISWLLMHWLLVWPGHQQPWYWYSVIIFKPIVDWQQDFYCHFGNTFIDKIMVFWWPGSFMLDVHTMFHKKLFMFVMSLMKRISLFIIQTKLLIYAPWT